MVIYLFMVVFVLLFGRVIVFMPNSSENKTKRRLLDGSIYSENEHNIKYILWFILLTVIAGCRGETVGTDTRGYISIFKAHNKLSSGNTDQEILFQYLNKIVGHFTSNPQWIFIVSTGITVFGVLFFIRRNSHNDTMSVFYYIALYYYFLGMNGMRQFIAIGVVLIATEFAKRRKLIPFIILILVAVGFHNTMLLGSVMWFIYMPNPSFRRMRIILIIMCFIILGFSIVQNLVMKYMSDYSDYISETEKASGIMMPVVYSSIFAIAMFVALFDKEWAQKPNNLHLLCISEIAMLWGISPLILTNISTNISQRLGWLFQIYSIVLIPNLLDSTLFKEKLSFYKIVFYAVGLSHLIYFLSKGWMRVVPYVFLID